MSTHQEQFNYLFDDIDAEMNRAYSVDPAIDGYKQRIQKHNDCIDKAQSIIDAAHASAAKVDMQIIEQKAVLRELQTQRRIVMADVNQANKRILFMRRLISQNDKLIEKRKKQLLKSEAMKRLRTLGHELKRNNGIRGGRGGGFDIVKVTDDKDFVRNEEVYQKIHKEPKQQEI